MKYRIAVAALLLVVAAAPVCDELFFGQHLRPEQMSGEDHFMRQFWAVASPASATLGLGLLLAARLRTTRGWLALVAVSAVLFAAGAWAVR